jgi:hypothetical protein
MINLINPNNNGNPIVIRYQTSNEVAKFSSFSDILDKQGVPPSKFAPNNTDAIGGLYDHVFGFNRDSFTATNRWLSIEGIRPGAGSWWTNFGEIIIGEIEGKFGGDYIWMVITDIEYINLEPVTSVKVTMHFGVDIYMANETAT